MKRSGPLKRTGFPRPVRVRHDDGVVELVGNEAGLRFDPLPPDRSSWLVPLRPGVYRHAGAGSAPRLKQEYVRSEKLLTACRLIPCQACGRVDGTVCAAHSNWQCLGGKGKSIKASDEYVAALCYECHSWLDQGSQATEEQRKAMWLPAWVSTVATLVMMQLWPQNVAVPDASINPFEVAEA